MNQILALILAAALALTGCVTVSPAGPGEISPSPGDESSPGYVNPSLMALREPEYPDFPTYPQEPEDNGDWNAYFKAQTSYRDALTDLRGEGVSPSARSSLAGFAGRSTALALAGHQGENAIYSPLSLWSALAMLAQCADGDSRRQVLDALGVDSVEALQDQVSQVWRGLYTDDGCSSLLLANSVWLNSGMEGGYVQDTLDVLAQRYYAGAYAVPMGTQIADQAVTNWIDEQTGGLIGGEGPVVKTTSDTLALLVSSLYYRAGWQSEFLPANTWEDTFTDPSGAQASVDFMHQTKRDSFLKRENYQAARLSTQQGEMVFVLPREGLSPEALLQDPEFLSGLDFQGADACHGKVEWSVPRFDVNSTLDLPGTLAALGVTDLLDRNRADLSALTSLDAYLSGAKQLSRVKVDEEGVEAAAVTILTMGVTSVSPEPDELCVMDLDRPFLFVIRAEGVPLFVGVVNRPEG